MARIDWLKRVFGYFEKNAKFDVFTGGGGYMFLTGDTTGKQVEENKKELSK